VTVIVTARLASALVASAFFPMVAIRSQARRTRLIAEPRAVPASDAIASSIAASS
jgi:hypothetical protein